MPEISTYNIVDRLSKSKLSVVYKAVDVNTNKITAIKVLLPNIAKDKSYVEELLKEAESAKMLKHKNTAQLIETGMTNVGDVKDIPYFVSEYIEGGNLDKFLIANKPLLELKAMKLTYQIAKALQYIHNAGLLHRSIKPENIIVSDTGEAILCDVGIATSMTKGNYTLKPIKEDDAFNLISPYCLSPEQVRGEVPDVSTDVYALGVILYRMLVAKYPFSGIPFPQIARKRLNQNPTPPHLIKGDIDRGLSNLVLNMMAIEPANRYRNMDEVIKNLDVVFEGGEVALKAPLPKLAPPTRAIPEKATTGKKSNLPIIITLSAAAVVIVALTIMLLLPSKNPPPAATATKTISPEVEKLLGEANRYIEKGNDMNYLASRDAKDLMACSEDMWRNPTPVFTNLKEDVLREFRSALENFSKAEVIYKMAIEKGAENIPLDELEKTMATARDNIDNIASGKIVAKATNTAENPKPQISTESKIRNPSENEVNKAEPPKVVTNEAEPTDNLGAQPVAKKDSEVKKVEVSKDAKSKADELYAAGVALANDKKYGEAIAQFSKAIETNPNFAEPYLYRGVVKHSIEDEEGAIADLIKALELNPKSVEGYNNLGCVYDTLGYYSTAVSCFDRAIKLNPNYALAYFNRGGALYALGSANTAVEDWKRASKLEPSLGKEINQWYEKVSGKKSKAKKKVVADEEKSDEQKEGKKEAKAADSEYAKSAKEKLDDKDYKGAVADFDKAIEENSQDATLYVGRGQAKVALKDSKGALADFNSAIKLDKKCAEAYKYRGDIYASSGKAKEAMVDYEKAKGINPDIEGLDDAIKKLKTFQKLGED